MGREANCICEWNGTPSQVKALIEPPDLILRGALRNKIPFAEMKRITTDGDKLCFTYNKDKVCLLLGKATAAKWAKSLLTPPPSLAKKLGIAPTSTVRIIGKIDEAALEQALSQSRQVTRGSAALVIARVNTPAELERAFAKSADLVANDAPIWIVYRKGPGHAITESTVRSTGLDTGIVDVKVASVSPELTALKFVKRKTPQSK